MTLSRSQLGVGPRTLAALVGFLTGLAIACAPAHAQGLLPQLPELPRLPDVGQVLEQPDEAVRQVLQPVQDIVNGPLPGPVEEVVDSSPVAPIRDTVRDTVNQVVDDPPVVGGGGAGGGGGGGSQDEPGSGSASAAGPAPAAGATGPAAGGDGGVVELAQSGRGEGARARGGAGRRGEAPAADRDPAGGEVEREAADRERTAAPARQTASGDERGSIGRTVDRIVEVVPGFVWLALGGVTLIALLLGGRAFVDHRRTRALLRERERLLEDMGLLERVLLPQVPERLGDLAASVAYRPAGGPAAGGDFYDVFALPDGRVAILVGDVSGHGREALEGTNALRPLLRRQLESGVMPRVAIESVGRAAGIDPSGRFTTVIAALHDPVAGTLTYAAAGHPPPVLVGRGAHDPVTAVSSPPLGVGLRTGVRQTVVSLPRGASACFFTDGLLEARLDGELVGREWLAGVVAELGPLDSATVLLDRVVEGVDEVPDDMTACVIRAVAGNDVVRARFEELTLTPDEVDSKAPLRFLEACGLPEEAIGPAIEDAERAAADTGLAHMTVTIDASGSTVRITGRTPEAVPTT